MLREQIEVGEIEQLHRQAIDRDVLVDSTRGAADVGPGRQEMSWPVYGAREVNKPARILKDPNLSVELLGPPRSGTTIRCLRRFFVALAVTDIRVIEGLSPEIDEFVIAAVSLVEFEPAELNWHSVSQRMRFEFTIRRERIGNKGSRLRLPAAGRKRRHRRQSAIDQGRNSVLDQDSARRPLQTNKFKRDFDCFLATGNSIRLKRAYYRGRGARWRRRDLRSG